MDDTVRKVEYFYVTIPDRAGQAAQILGSLAAEGVNLLAFSGFPSGRRTQLDLVPDDASALRRAARKLGLELSPRKTGFLIQGEDRIGAMTGLLDTLAAARINVTAVDAVGSGDGRFGALLWVAPSDVARAGRLMKATSGPASRQRLAGGSGSTASDAPEPPGSETTATQAAAGEPNALNVF
jgi:hypothetical protein